MFLLADDVQRVDVGDLRRVVAASLTAGAVAAARAEGVAEEEDEESEEGPREAEEQVEVPQDLPPDRVVLAPVAGALAAGGSADAARAERVPAGSNGGSAGPSGFAFLVMRRRRYQSGGMKVHGQSSTHGSFWTSSQEYAQNRSHRVSVADFLVERGAGAGGGAACAARLRSR